MPATILLLTDSKSVEKILLETPTVMNLTFKKFNFVAQCYQSILSITNQYYQLSINIISY